jgi:hypothetical protein
MKTKISGVLAFGLTLSIGLGTGVARAEDESYYSFHPRSILSLGNGFSPNNMTEVKLRCLDFRAEPAAGESGALDSTLNTYMVNDSSTMKTLLGIDVKIEASYLTAKASAGLTLNTDQMFKSDSATMMILAKSEYGRLVMLDPKLTAYAESLRRTDPGAFARECGTHLVKMIRRGAMVAVFVTITNLTEEQKQKLRIDVEASGSSGAASAKMKFGFEQALERSRASNSVRTQIISTGGPGISGLASLVEKMSWSPDSLKQIEDAVAQFMREFSKENPAPIGFYTAPFGFGVIDAPDLWGRRLQNRLISLAERFTELEAKALDIKHVLNPEDPRHASLSADQISTVERALVQTDDAIDLVADAHKACMVEHKLEACKTPQYSIADYFVPAMPARPVLEALQNPRVGVSNLRIQGTALSKVKVFLNDTKILEEEIIPGLEKKEVDLAFFWQSRRSRVRGIVSGQVVIEDRYGRSTTYVFFRAIHTEGGSIEPLSQTFSPEGRL